jgi:hypothetical protein
LESSHFILSLSHIEASLVHDILELNGNFGIVEIRVSLLDMRPIIVRMGQGHGRFEVIGIKVNTYVMVLIIVDFIVAVLYLLARTIPHLRYLLHVLTQRVNQLAQLLL